MDQCTHCTVRGDEKACQETPCNLHESWMVKSLRAQLLATQAHAARLVEALEIAEYGDAHFDHRGDGQNYCPECGEKKGCAHSQNCIIGKALSTPINLAALHEDRARECERLANLFPRGSIPAHNMLEEAAAHRAKKEGK